MEPAVVEDETSVPGPRLQRISAAAREFVPGSPSEADVALGSRGSPSDVDAGDDAADAAAVATRARRAARRAAQQPRRPDGDFRLRPTDGSSWRQREAAKAAGGTPPAGDGARDGGQGLSPASDPLGRDAVGDALPARLRAGIASGLSAAVATPSVEGTVTVRYARGPVGDAAAPEARGFARPMPDAGAPAGNAPAVDAMGY